MDFRWRNVRQSPDPMPHAPSKECLPHVTRAQLLLGLSQEDLASKLGVSRRSITRWYAGQSMPGVEHLAALARMVHRTDASVAARLAEEGGTSLAALGLVTVAPAARSAEPPLAAPGPPPPPRPFPPTRLMVESIVCAAAETMQTVPSEVREVLRAAFSRARGLGLTTEEVDDALSPPVEPAAPTPVRTQEPDVAKGRARRGE
jgi:transcriptional regulator with XRE-family HTH domain